MTNQRLDQVLTKAANSDLALCRKHGAMTVAQTKLGNLHMTYSKGTYTVVAQAGMQVQTVCVGKASDARAILVAAYDVVQG